MDIKQEPLPIYLNSSQESTDTSQNNVNVSYRNPIQIDPEEIGLVTLANFQAFNTLANVTKSIGNNVVTILNSFRNNTTGDTFVYEKTITLPDGRYSTDSLFEVLNAQCNWQVTVTGANWTSDEAETESILYLGFGFNGQNNAFCSTPLLGFALNPTDPCLIAYFPATFQGTTDGNAYQKSYTSGSISTDPFAYTGVYLKLTDATSRFLSMMGFNVKQPQSIDGGYFGFGYAFSYNGLPNPVAPQSPSLCYNLSGPSLLYFTLDTMSTGSRHNDENMDSRNIIGIIPIDVPYGGMISYTQSFDQYSMVKSQMSYTSMRIVLYDQDGQQVDFRSQRGWTACLHLIFKGNSRNNTQMIAPSDNLGQYAVDTSARIHHGAHRAPHPLGGTSNALSFSKRSRLG